MLEWKPMNRRDLLRNASLYSFASLASGLIVPGAFALPCNTNTHPSYHPHLQGVIPEGAVPTLSSTGSFHHFHFLHVPQQILAKIPRSGFRTLTSMMKEECGIDDFFFQRGEENKQFHCHQIDFTREQLISIADGKPTEIIAFIRSGGRPVRNHSFIFNDTITFEQKQQAAKETADFRGFKTERIFCDTRLHGMVTVFHGGGIIGVRTLAQIDQLKGY